MSQYPDHMYKPFSVPTLALLIVIGLIGMALQECGAFLGC